MIFFLLLFSIGYTLGLVEFKKTNTTINYTYQNHKFLKVLFWTKVCIVIISIVQLGSLVSSISSGTLNLSISQMGEAYINSYAGYVRGTGHVSLVFLIQTLTYVPYLVTLILGSYYFKNLPRSYKVLVVFSYLSIILLQTIGHGKQKQLGDIIVFIFITQILKFNLQNKNVRKKIFKKMAIFALLGMSALVTVLYFRYSALNINLSNINDHVHPLMKYDIHHWIFKVFGAEIGFPLSVFTGYLSQGYYGLSLCMQEPFQWTYFVGNSYSLTVFLQRFLHVPVDFHNTYLYRASLHTGWGDNKWSTAFAWYAGDLTFVGTLFFFMLVAFLYAKVWKEAYLYKNPISIVLFSMLTIGLLYIPANNQLLHTPGSFIAVFCFIILWIFKHQKFNFYKTKQ
ncbi:MAG: hypothetical protein R3331_11450 [Sulfurospirillaceae bacterium]|nr:hypothetical protein [Sulfurospirillaceae bacterium]